MRHYILLFILYIYSVGQLVAQIISGKVVDSQNNPLPYVSVVLQNVQDSSYVCGTTTDSEGLFTLQIQEDIEYTLFLSYMGYETVKTECRYGNLGTIVMKEDSKKLDEVVVLASRIQNDANGYTINLCSSKISKGKQASDLLAFLPCVSNENGSYKINGLQVSEIYVDGAKLTSIDELKNIPADIIDRVKVNYLAGVKQNAANAGGTIEITLHKLSQGGYYGSWWGGADYHLKNGFSNEHLGGVIYYHINNLSIYDNLSVDFNQPEETAKQSIWEQITNQHIEIDEEAKYRGYTLRNRLSLTQQLNDKGSLGGSYYIGMAPKWDTHILDKGTTVLSSVDNKNSYLVQEATLKYNTYLSQRGTTMELIGDYLNRQHNSQSDYTYGQNSTSKSEDKTTLNMYKFSVDLTDPRNQKLTWNYGASIQYITSKYTPLIGSIDSYGRFQTSRLATSTIGLTPLAYASVKGNFGKIHYNIGVNFQLNKIQYKALDNCESSSNTQWGINPTLQMMMPLGNNGKHSLKLNYKRTLEDIPYSAISSTIRWSDSYNYSVGNPDLKAQSTDRIIANVSMFHNLLTLTAYYLRKRNTIYWETRQSPTASDVFFTTFINLPANNGYGAGAEVNWSPVKSWTTKLSCRFDICPENMTLGGVYYGKTRLRQYFFVNNTFSFAHGWGGMLNIRYEPTFKDYAETLYTVWDIWGQIYKFMCKDKLQLSLSFSPLGDRRKYDRWTNGNKITYDYTTPVQSIGFSLRWKFSNGKDTEVNVVEYGSQHYYEIQGKR